MTLPSFEFTFEPDIYAEEELAAETGYVIDKTLITDIEIKKCRIIASVCTVEYGTIDSQPGALLVFRFVFHPFGSRFKDATLIFSFDGNTVVRALGPESVKGNENEKTIRNKLHGEFSIGYPPINFTIGGERETEETAKSMMRIQGSGEDTPLVRWTMQENGQEKSGLPEKFIAAIILQAKGEIDVSIKIHATIGRSMGIRKICVDDNFKLGFDGKTKLGRRPEGMVVADNVFVAA
jgi:hypothetical protein